MAPPKRPSKRAMSASETLQPSIEDSTQSQLEDEEQPIPGRSAPTTLEERIQVAIQRRDELLSIRRLRALEEEITRLEGLNRDPSVPLEEEDPDIQVISRRKRGAAEALESIRVKRTLKPKDPTEYKGRNLKEHREFFRSCETAFRLLPQEFHLDSDKVTWAMQYLGGDSRELWYTHYERNFEARGAEMTWVYFKQYMLDLLSDPINRSLEAATAHAQAMQRKDQTVRSFATYLEVLEDQLTPYTETQRVQHLFSKLKPELQRAITNYHQIPATREDLIALGSTLERNLRRFPLAHEQPVRNIAKGKSKETTLGLKSSEPINKRQDKGNIICYKCNKLGHYANECRSSNPNHTPLRINQTGKGRASSSAQGQ